MRKFLITRLSLSLFVLYVIATLMFFMFKFLPGDPTMFFISESTPSAEVIARQKALWGLDDPIQIQYLRYIKNMATFDFGTSFRQMRPVAPIIVDKLLNTLSMMLPSFVLIVFISVAGGAFIGWNRGSRLEQVVLLVTLVAHSAPPFFLGILLLMVFSYGLAWLPSGGMREPGSVFSFWQAIFSLDFVRHLILPVATLVIRGANGPLLVMRTSVIENKGEDFIDILRAQGVPEWRIVWHAGRNALLPLVTYLGVLVGFYFQGQVLLETVFSWPGIGRLIVDALNIYDFPIVQAAFFVSAVAIVGMNLVVDILYSFLDPRVRYD